ncbi:MAG: type II/IV secretion system ATPase subunit [Candidatus Thermoplasmatota archaeon]|nr:type II/IV secretion system ATPase subunit [Candidatus Thermoplasmatota archaeon]
MQQKRNQKRKNKLIKTISNIPLATHVITMQATFPKIKINLHPNENKTQKHNEKFKEKQQIQYKEIVKQIDTNQTTFKKTRPSNTSLIEEKKGYGWMGLGSRQILYDNDKKEYLYHVIEPSLIEKQEQTKDKLIILFKKYADVDVYEGDTAQKWGILEKALEKILHDKQIKLDSIEKNIIFYYIMREFVGYGRIDILMHDPEIEDISCDGHGIPIFVVHKQYESIKTNIVYKDADELDSFVVKLSQMCGKQISVFEPVVDGKLADGSRLQTTLGRTITMLSTFTIRRFREDPLTPIDLLNNNTISLDLAAYFWLTIEKGCNILFCGGTASGKTTMLNALSLFVPPAYKIVSIEDTREINLPHENWIAGTTRSGFTSTDILKTTRDIDMFDLIRVALRQRPRVIIVGEVRGKEAYSLFQAMTTGHLSYSTVHASDMHSLIQRLENPPISLPRALLTSLDTIVFLNSVIVKGNPVRRITNVTEIIELDAGTNRLVTMSPFEWVGGSEDRFQNNGSSRLLYKIRLENGWTDAELHQELQNRMDVLEWMKKQNLRSYTDVGKIVGTYMKDPDTILKNIKREP